VLRPFWLMDTFHTMTTAPQVEKQQPFASYQRGVIAGDFPK